MATHTVSVEITTPTTIVFFTIIHSTPLDSPLMAPSLQLKLIIVVILFLIFCFPGATTTVTTGRVSSPPVVNLASSPTTTTVNPSLTRPSIYPYILDREKATSDYNGKKEILTLACPHRWLRDTPPSLCRRNPIYASSPKTPIWR
ncbi:hypothetical protein HanIR_Chr05g0224091 [Helianthus annuus]|nr:hypothetical protein HanIR_Chr05g0224091 [Helianthus annuus]